MLEENEMTPDQQLEEWVKGNPIHNNNRWYSVCDKEDKVLYREKMEGGECTPDFSCCNPKLLWPEEVRLSFKNASEEERNAMMGMALNSLVKSVAAEHGVKVHLIGASQEVLH